MAMTKFSQIQGNTKKFEATYITYIHKRHVFESPTSPASPPYFLAKLPLHFDPFPRPPRDPHWGALIFPLPPPLPPQWPNLFLRLRKAVEEEEEETGKALEKAAEV